MLLTIAERIGKIAQTVLGGSAIASVENLIGRNLSHVDWVNGKGERNPQQLDKFIRETYKNISFRGINPLFLSVGALRWQVQASGTEFREVSSPLLIFPIKLVRSASSTPVAIEFVDDEIYFNPCLYQKMLQTLPGDTAMRFPHPNGPNAKHDDPIDLELLGDGNAYFESVAEYVRACRRTGTDVTFEFEQNTVAIAQYDHSDLCMYYDCLRNRERIEAHPLVRAIFDPSHQAEAAQSADPTVADTYPYFVLPHDSVQEEMTVRALNGESMIIKGPPGTGKTVTIANMIAALIAERKSVLLVSSKISALSEAYHKLPEELRKFALLLDYESEKQAAKIDPSLIKRDLSDLLEAARCSDLSDSVYEARSRARSDRSNATLELERHHRLTFTESDVVGESYYRAMERVCRYPDLRVIGFAKPEQLLSLSATQYQELLSDVRDASAELEILSEHGAAPAWRNPWYGVQENVDVERAGDYLERIGEKARGVSGAVQDASACLRSEPLRSSVTLLDMRYASRLGAWGQDPALLQRMNLRESDFTYIRDALSAFEDASVGCSAEWIFGIGSLPTEALETSHRSIPDLMLDDSLRVREVKMLYLYRSVFADARDIPLKKAELTSLAEICDRIVRLRNERSACLSRVWEVFRKTEDADAWKRIRNAAAPLKRYAESVDISPRLLDLRARLAVRRLLPLCYLADTPFADLVSAVMLFALAEEKQIEIDGELRGMARIYKKELTEREVEATLACIHLGELLGRTGTGLSQICAAHDAVTAFAREMACEDHEMISDLKQKYKALQCYRTLCSVVAEYGERVAITHDPKTAHAAAKVLLAWYKTQRLCQGTDVDPVAVFAEMGRIPSDVAAELGRLIAAFAEFGREFFQNRYTLAPESLTLADLEHYAARCGDSSFARAALRYRDALLRHTEQVKLESFFRPFAYGEAVREPSIGYDDYFEHTVYSLALQGKRSKLQSTHASTGRAIAPSYEKIARADRELEEYNRAIIEKKLLCGIKPDDRDYRFLSHERGAGTSVRRLFAEHAESILKLKKCIILSPSTASVLFKNPAYAEFDTVIIDEASQMKSVTLLPVLSRAKQCVIVGDEWQMPPISHFESKSDSSPYRDDEDRPEPSALSLALRSAAFYVTTLVCHYRSRTESLIKFSQERYYPMMRTFPSPVPKTEGLGFSDIYLPDGLCEDGVNEVEAQAMVDCIRRHFTRYYDNETGRLTRAFGVVTFGLPQLDRIRAIIRADRRFADLWHHNTERQDVDDPFFYCTVETVQGQQTTDLYLSMTYTGRSSLNQNELGGQVFNVAVSRATDSVTVIHSRRAEETKPDYVRDYLRIVEYFSADAHTPFVCREPESNFQRLLREHIVERYGISRDRVLCDYGATDGSVRIPLVILSPDRREAQLGIFCEGMDGNRYHYVDYHVRYHDILCQMRGWRLHRVFLHDWLENTEAEHRLLDAAIRESVSL